MRLLLITLLVVFTSTAYAAKPHKLIPTDCSGALGILLQKVNITKEAIFLAKDKNRREILYLLRQDGLFKMEQEAQNAILKPGNSVSGDNFVPVKEGVSVAPATQWFPLVDTTRAAPPPEGSVGALPEMDFHQYDVAQKAPGSNLQAIQENRDGTVLHCDGTAEYGAALTHKKLRTDFVVAIPKEKKVELFLLQRVGPRITLKQLKTALPSKARVAQKKLQELGENPFHTIKKLGQMTIEGTKLRLR